MKKLLNDNWQFTKDAISPEADHVTSVGRWEQVSLPHTWNGKDGQDGGDDYYRGTCYYAKTVTREELGEGAEVYLEFEGTNSSATCYVNGNMAGSHDGGYSTWRVNITKFLQDENEIVIAVDNAPNNRVYPQKADFTFYGGIYRNINVISVGESRFDLDYFGSTAIKVTPEVKGEDATVEVKVYTTGVKAGQKLSYQLFDEGQEIAEKIVDATETTVSFDIENVHLWNGLEDPHLYTAEVKLMEDGTVLDERSTRFGCRTFEIDPEEGFILNGKSYPLRGVSRHQDRPDIGNALTEKEHAEDIDLILEMGANTIRLAHYQHNQYFYDLCDEKGLVIWAEIPYISQHMPTGRENTITQMTELIAQNYNHPCIVVWGLSNEITMGGDADKDLLRNHNILNDLCHEMDPTRLTTIAVVSMCSIDSPYIQIPDVISYNHYYGWYGGDTSMNGPFFDNFHAKYPNIPIGMSEYGCEALNWHSSTPDQGDYTEEYQAYYHEELIKQLYTRKFIWATHVWNMFDFAADARSEGGEDGMNHKGLVTFDRKYKKDAFYAYKAWLSKDPFVHICGKRYVDRVEDVTKVTVYSNQPEVELFVNGESLGKQTSDVHFFYFDVPNVGESELVAVAGDCRDESHLRKVDVFNEDYRMKETGDVLNWFDVEMPEGYYNINDKMSAIMQSPEGAAFVMNFMKSAFTSDDPDKGMPIASEGAMQMLSGFTLRRMLGMLTMGGAKAMTKDEMIALNQQLNQIARV